MKDRLTTIKNHVIKHRFKYGLGVGIAATAAVLTKRAQEWREFAIEEGVMDAYTTEAVAAE